MGDFNLIEIDWFTPRTVLNYSVANEKLSLFSQRCGFSQNVLEPSYDNHFTDLVFLSHNNLVTHIKVDILFSNSDHNSVEVLLLSIVLNKDGVLLDSCTQFPPTNNLNFNKIDYAGFASELFHTNWSDIFSVHFHINHALDMFIKYITSLIVKFTLIKPNFNGRRPSYQSLPRDILNLARKKKIAWSIYKKYRRNLDKSIFKALTKLVRTRIDAYR